MKYFMLAASVLLVSACQAAPAGPAAAAVVPVAAASAPEPAATTQVASVDDDIVCRSMKVTGTRFAKRECKTAEAWKAYDDYTSGNARDATNKFQRLNSGCSTQAQGTC